jgi:hypothetical protein
VVIHERSLRAIIVDDHQAILLDDVELLDVGQVEVGCVLKGDDDIIDVGGNLGEVVPDHFQVEDSLLLLLLSLSDADH